MPSPNDNKATPAPIEGTRASCTLSEMTQAMADIYARYSGGPEW